MTTTSEPDRRIIFGERDGELAGSGCGCGMVVGGILVAFAGTWLGYLISLGFQLTLESILGAVVATIVGAFGVYVLGLSVQNLVANKRLGDVEVDVVPRKGDGFDLAVGFSPSDGLRLTGVTATVSCVQFATSKVDSSDVYKEDAFLQEHQLSSEQTLYGGETVRVSTFIELPDDAPLSTVSDNDEDLATQTYWELTLRIGIFRWPDHVEVMRFEVLPPEASSGESETDVAFTEAERSDQNEPATAEVPVDSSGIW